jgi:hypothetical protein
MHMMNEALWHKKNCWIKIENSILYKIKPEAFVKEITIQIGLTALHISL